MSDNEQNKIRPRRGIYLLPNLFTVAALFAGFYGIIAATKHQYETAVIAIFIALLLDGLDGRIARLTHTQTEFGAQFDSLSDMVCFGVSPALVLYNWSLIYLGKIGWLAAFIYTACTGLRLARFNSQAKTEKKSYFSGLSTTAAAGFVAALIWTATHLNIDGEKYAIVVIVVTVLIALLKVSTIRYRSFKDINLQNKVPYLAITIIVLAFALISINPPYVFLVIFSIYVLSGPFESIWWWRKYRSALRKRRKRMTNDK